MSDISYIEEVDDEGELPVIIEVEGNDWTFYIDILDLRLMAEQFGYELVPIHGVN